MSQDSQSLDNVNAKGQLPIEKIENYLMGICAEFSKKKRLIQIETLYTRARRELGAPRVKIETAIDNLVRNKKILPNRFQHANNVLENATRQRIYNAINAVPSLIVQDLRNNLELGPKMALWHLKRLLDFGIIKRINRGTKTLYAAQRVSDQDAIAYNILVKNNLLQRVLFKLDHKKLAQSLIIEIAPTKRTNLLYHLKKLTEDGIIDIIEDNQEKIYQIKAEYRNAVMQMIERYFPVENLKPQ